MSETENNAGAGGNTWPARIAQRGNRNVFAILLGLALGYMIGRLAFSGHDMTMVILFGGFIITPFPICLIATRRWVWVSVIPVATIQVTLLASSYLYAYKPDGMDLQSYLRTRVYPHLLMWLLCWIPAIAIASSFYVFKTQNDYLWPLEKNRE